MKTKFVRIALPRILNYLLYALSCFMAGTGLALVIKLPPGSRGGHGLTMLGLNRHEWGDLHFYAGLLLLALARVHLGLHWSWLKKALQSVRGGIGWMGLAAGLVLLVLPLLFPVVEGR